MMNAARPVRAAASARVSRYGLRLPQEPLGQGGGGGDLEVQHLHRHVAVQGVVPGPEHGGEPALPQQRADGKFLSLFSQRLLKALLEGGEVQGHGGRKT